MTTFSQLKKYAERDFLPGMRARGFDFHKGWIFTRDSAMGISLILSFDIQSKVRLRVYPFLWLPELDAHKPNFVFPDDTARYADFPTYRFSEWPSCWEIESEEEVRRSLSDLLSKLDQFVIPWAKQIDDGESFVKLLDECFELSDPRILALVPLILERYKKRWPR